MTSTLKRSLTDIMEDELYYAADMNENSEPQQQQQQAPPPVQQHQSSDFFQYLTLPNNSQDSLQKQSESENSSQVIDHNSHTHQQQHNTHSLDNIYNSYGNPNLYTNPQLPDYLYSNPATLDSPIMMIDDDGNNTDHNTTVMSPINTYSFNSSHNVHNYTTPNTTINTVDIKETPDNAQDDILMVPQDNYFNYDYQDSQITPEMLQLEISNKNFPQSNELNLFKPNDVMYDEFSDDEDEDDDIDMNKLDGDMDMKLDDDDDDESSDDDDDDDNDDETDNYVNNNNNGNYHLHNHEHHLDYSEDYNASNYLSLNDNSIYSLTVPNQFTSLSPPSNENTLYVSEDDEDDDEDNHMHSDDDEEDEEDEYDEEINADSAIDADNDGDLYTSAFQQRKESVLLDTKPVIKKERSLSARRSTRPKRLRRSSNHIASNPLSTSSFRKPRISNTAANTITNSPSATNTTATTNTDHSAIADDDDENKDEEHVCNIPNPKTGKPCLKRFSRPYDLVRHQNTIHASKRSFFRCMFCEDDLRRKHELDSVNKIVIACKYRNTQCSKENSISHVTSSHNVKKIKSGSLDNAGYLSNKTFSRCDALTRHLRFRHGLNNNQVLEAMDFAKKNVEYYDN